MYRKFIFQLFWLPAIFFAIWIGIPSLLPFPYSLLPIIGITLVLSYYIRKREVQKDDSGTILMLVPKLMELVIIGISFVVVAASILYMLNYSLYVLSSDLPLSFLLISICVLRTPRGKSQEKENIILGILMIIIGGMILIPSVENVSLLFGTQKVFIWWFMLIQVPVGVVIGLASLDLAYNIFKRYGKAVRKMTWAFAIILAIFSTILVGWDLINIKEISSLPFFVTASYIKNMVIIGLIFYYLRKADLKMGLGMIKSNDTIS